MAAAWKRLVEGNWAKRLASMAVAKERRMQENLDMAKLHFGALIFQAHKRGHVQMRDVLSQNHHTNSREQYKVVEQHVKEQIMDAAKALHAALLQAGDAAPAASALLQAEVDVAAEKENQPPAIQRFMTWMQGKIEADIASAQRRAAAYAEMEKASKADLSSLNIASVSSRSSGWKGSSNSSTNSSMSSSSSCSSTNLFDQSRAYSMSQQALAAALQQQVGFTLSVRPSTIKHAAAGNGLFLHGEAKTGTLIAFCPGIYYARTQYRHMPNFPEVSLDNDYLNSRFDLGIVDSKPWSFGAGSDRRVTIASSPGLASTTHQNSTAHPHVGSGAAPGCVVPLAPTLVPAAMALHDPTLHHGPTAQSDCAAPVQTSGVDPPVGRQLPSALGQHSGVSQRPSHAPHIATAQPQPSPPGQSAFVAASVAVAQAPAPGQTASHPHTATAACSFNLPQPPPPGRPAMPSQPPPPGQLPAAVAAAAPRPGQPAATVQQPTTQTVAEWPVWTGPDCGGLAYLEGRHPLALGHFVNHPTQGNQPNVLEFAFDIRLDAKDPAWLRAYLPNVGCDAGRANAAAAVHGDTTVRGLALMAIKPINDGDEIFQDYRLSPYIPRPAWYESFDAAQELRRWKPLAIMKDKSSRKR